MFASSQSKPNPASAQAVAPCGILKPVIVCADDFALHRSASMGIAALARQQRISATSVMVLSPRWAKDAALLQDFRGQIDVGLHLDWSSDFARALGHGLTLGAAMRRALLGGFNQNKARLVLESQLDLFEAYWQAPPAHVDGHQHVQQFAGMRQILVEVLARRYGAGAAMPYVRISRPTAASADFKARIIAAMGAAALEQLAARAGISTTPALLGVYDFRVDAANYARLMQNWLKQAPANAIIMCHPAQGIELGDAIALARAQEFAYLSSAQFASALVEAGAVPARGRFQSR